MQRYLILLLILFVSCTAKKKAAEFEMQPDWVKQKPYIPGYYIGVGSVKKIGTSADYTTKARQAALTDLAEEISSNVSATSVLHTIETEYGHSETFDQRIQVSTDDYLEGFEPVAFYETPDSYWVYFKIEKSTYHAMKEKKKQEAIATAVAKYQSGMQEQQINKPKEALTFYLQGLQAIKKYLNEETSTQLNGSTLDIGNALYSSANEIINLLSIEAITKEINIKRGKSFDKTLLFKVQYKNKPAQDIPIEFSYTGGYLKKDRQNSDATGYVQLEPEPIFSKNSTEQIVASINLKEIAQKAVEDLFIRGLILKRNLKPAIVVINITNPSLAIVIADKTCNDAECDRINSIFNQNITHSNFKLASKTDSDYIFELNYTIKPGESAGGLVSVYLTGELKIINKNKNHIWTKQTENFKGVGYNADEAKEKAFNEFCNALDRKLFKQGLESIK